LAELKSLPKLARMEGLAERPGRGSQEEAKEDVPSRVIDRAENSIPGSKFPG
jgi:hypothetical protein